MPYIPGDLATGQTFVLVVDSGLVGDATWVPITDAVGNATPVADPFAYVNSTGGRAAADEVGGTPYNHPEDMILKTVASGNEAILFTTTGEGAVYTVEFTGDDEADARLLAKVGVTTDYSAGLPVTGGSSGFASPDNLAIDAEGRVYLIEDQGNGGPIGGDVWATCDVDNDGVAESMARFFSLSSLGAEPSGMIFDPSKPNSFVIVAQHPNSSSYIYNGVEEAGEIGEALIRVTKKN